MNIKEIQREIHQVNVEKGFWEDRKNVGEVLMLIVSELGEALEAHRSGKSADYQSFAQFTETQNATGEEYAELFRDYMKDTFEDEIADTVIRIFDMCEGFGIDLEAHIVAKLEYNKTRPYKHGKKY